MDELTHRYSSPHGRSVVAVPRVGLLGTMERYKSEFRETQAEHWM